MDIPLNSRDESPLRSLRDDNGKDNDDMRMTHCLCKAQRERELIIRKGPWPGLECE